MQTCWNELLYCWWQRIWIPQRLKFCMFGIFIVLSFFVFDQSERCAQLLVIYNPSKIQGGATITNTCWRSETKIGGQILLAPLNSLCYYLIQWLLKSGFDETIKNQLIQIKKTIVIIIMILIMIIVYIYIKTYIYSIHIYWNMPKPYNNRHMQHIKI